MGRGVGRQRQRNHEERTEGKQFSTLKMGKNVI